MVTKLFSGTGGLIEMRPFRLVFLRNDKSIIDYILFERNRIESNRLEMFDLLLIYVLRLLAVLFLKLTSRNKKRLT